MVIVMEKHTSESNIERVMAGLTDLERYKILRGNAVRMLGLPHDPGQAEPVTTPAVEFVVK